MTTTTTSASDLDTPSPPDLQEALRAALSTQVRPHRPNPLIASLIHSWRAVLKMKHGLAMLLADITILPIMFLLVFTYLFGGAFAGSTGNYLNYFLPGVLVQAVVLTTVYTGTSLANDITKGIFDRFRTLPFWQPATIVGSLATDVMRYLIAMVSTTAVALLLGFRPGGGTLGVLAGMGVLLLFGFSISWIFAALGVVVKNPEYISGASMIVMFPLVFASNIFVDPATMPGWMQVIVNINPVSHAATAVRGLMHGAATAGQLGWLFGISALVVVIFAPLTMYLYHKKTSE